MKNNELTDLAKQFKRLGNRKFTKSEYWDAITKCTQGITKSPTDTNLISNRALAYLNIGCSEKALSDIDHVLLLNPLHEKCLFRRIKALWGLQRYEEALDFMQTQIPKHILAQADFKSLHQKCHKMLKQSTGDYDIQEIMSLPRNSLNEVAEYTGPVEIAQVAGKGRGLLATMDIHPGQLIMCSKAFALVLDDDLKAKGFSGYNNRDYFLSMISQKLLLEPNLHPQFFGLYPALQVTKDISSNTACKVEVEVVDSIIKFNSFAGDKDPWPWADGTPNFWGLWILPSFINHSCMDCNAYYCVYGDIMFIRAVRPIQKGQEVIITYTPPTNQSRRKEIMEMHAFKCNCRLCHMEDEEDPEVGKEIEETLELIREGLSSSDLTSQIARIQKLTSLRPKYPKTNMALLDPCIEMVCSQLADKEEWRVFANLFEKSHSVTANNCYVINAVNISIVMLQCYVHLGDQAEIRKWIKQLKQDLVTAYGSVEAIRCIRCKILNTLKSAGFDFFEDC